MAQRIFFAYCYHRYQVAANPRIADWFQEREAFRKGQVAETGPKPRLPSASVRGGRGGGVSGRGRRGYSRHAGHEGLQTFVIPQVLQWEVEDQQEGLPFPAAPEPEKAQG